MSLLGKAAKSFILSEALVKGSLLDLKLSNRNLKGKALSISFHKSCTNLLRHENWKAYTLRTFY